MKLNIGPGALVAAAFIGPGTVTACTLAGAQFGYALIWALLFATIATIILQDMAARLGVGARLGLGQAFMQVLPRGALRYGLAGLIFIALAIGNGAYEAGNLAGAALGAQAIIGTTDHDSSWSVWIIAAIAGLALWQARYQTLERLLVMLVLLMSLAFVATALLVQPQWSQLLAGLRPTIPAGGVLTAVALIGTTIVPYNLFLHAAASRKRWSSAASLRHARQDSAVAIGLGGLISILIIATSASALFQSGLSVNSAADMAVSLQPLFGDSARFLLGVGLLGAGLTSAITAPMATAYALGELADDNSANDTARFRGIALAVLAAGLLINTLGLKPLTLILMAQVANGLLLPIIAGFLLYVMNQRATLGSHANGWFSNLAGALVLLVTLGLGARAIMKAFGWSMFGIDL
ncbi:MAG: Nramp family divalent metal transporter [Gammaproteobacteria bacterium]|nr:Nramp family divalent metal transporter [Gammaproteobacteria bacterium]